MKDSKALMLSILITVPIVGACLWENPPAMGNTPQMSLEALKTPPVHAEAAMQDKLMSDLLDQVHAESMLRAIKQVESHGDCKAVSKKGAKGCYQIMDATAKNPGFGVKAKQNNSDAEQKRLAKEYTAALHNHFEKLVEKLVIYSYNGGVGRVDRALNQALASLPVETQEYLVKVQLAENE